VHAARRAVRLEQGNLFQTVLLFSILLLLLFFCLDAKKVPLKTGQDAGKN